MTTLSSSLHLVNALRGGYATENPLCFCQCGKFCPKGDACAPVRGEVRQPDRTIRETATPQGRAWTGCLYDPQAQRYTVHTLFGRWYPTPCAAVDVMLTQALRTQQYPIRLDLAGTDVELTAIEQRAAQKLWDMGYTMFVDQTVPDFRHPLIEAGYNAAQAEAAAAISEKDPGFTWDLSTVSTVPAGVMPTCSNCGGYLGSDGSCARGCR